MALWSLYTCHKENLIFCMEGVPVDDPKTKILAFKFVLLHFWALDIEWSRTYTQKKNSMHRSTFICVVLVRPFLIFQTCLWQVQCQWQCHWILRSLDLRLFQLKKKPSIIFKIQSYAVLYIGLNDLKMY